MRVLDLFSGIGAFSLGLQRAGMHTVAFCEIDPFCRLVLAKHWPGVPCYDDVRTLTAEQLSADGITVDVICGGFPCQDISVAGRGAGITGKRSSLWREFVRIIGEVGPQYVIVENVAALLGRGLGDVLGDLASLGYDAEWHCIPAAAVGAPHRRDRIWIVAYTNSGRWREQGDVGEAAGDARTGQPRNSSALSNTNPATASRLRLNAGVGRLTISVDAFRFTEGAYYWAVEPDVGRVVDGAASRVDRRKRLIGLGNSLVPQIPEMIGSAIFQREAARAA